jgi:hypothetical protein
MPRIGVLPVVRADVELAVHLRQDKNPSEVRRKGDYLQPAADRPVAAGRVAQHVQPCGTAKVQACHVNGDLPVATVQ